MKRGNGVYVYAVLSGAAVLSLLAASCTLDAGLEQRGKLRTAAYIPVVLQGKGQARLVIPADASDLLKDGAKLLAETIEKSTGARLEVTREPAPEDGLVAIHCGAT